MTASATPSDALTVSSNFLRAVRESGYINLSTALAELVDNSIQAGATSIEISISRPAPNGFTNIEVTDNGTGMGPDELTACLQFGGTSRFDGRASLGRFGMGLPAASLSQTRHVEVAAWQHQKAAWAVTLDVDEVVAGESVDLSARPSAAGRTPTGCRVTWRDCDRIEYRRLAWLERSLQRDLGRMFRRFLSDGLILTINGTALEPLDPTLLTTIVEGASAKLAFDPRRFEINADDGTLAFVTVRFSMLPIRQWHGLDNVTKRRLGIVGQGGVSILRAGREIANGWHLMGGKRKENYDDWWRCEIEFDPVLDELFGITINKQGVRPSARLREALEPELESIARLLNARVRQSFEDVKFRVAADKSCRVAASADPDLPVLPGGRRNGASGPLSYRISTGQLPPESMLAMSLRSNTLEVQLNIDHPAFTALYQPLRALPDDIGTELRTAIELLLLSFARSATSIPEGMERLVVEWGATYGRMLQKA